jgi:hypothetical protein
MRPMLDAGLLVLVDVSAKNPEVGDENASVLGTLLVNAIWGAASSRVKGSFSCPTYLWIDEFHLFVTRDIEKMMAEARGFGVGVYVATQYYGQLPDYMKDALLNNAWTKWVGRVNGPDEARLASSIFQGVDAGAIMSLPKYTWITQVAADQQPTTPFTLKAFSPLPADRLHQAYLQANGGKTARPIDNGAVPYDFFSGVTLMDAGERKRWEQHQSEMADRVKALGTIWDDHEAHSAQAEYLAELSGDDWNEYVALRRKADVEEYQRLVNDPKLVPDVPITDEDAKILTEKGKRPEMVARAKRIRRLSSLKVEVPRREVIAADIRLTRESLASAESVDVVNLANLF